MNQQESSRQLRNDASAVMGLYAPRRRFVPYALTLGRTVKIKNRWATVYVSLANVELGPRVAYLLNPSKP